MSAESGVDVVEKDSVSVETVKADEEIKSVKDEKDG